MTTATSMRTVNVKKAIKSAKPPARRPVQPSDTVAEPSAERQSLTLALESDHVSWGQLQDLFARDPALAFQEWDRIVATARDELRAGNRAARAIESAHATPKERAEFLVMREELGTPRNGIERTLLDTLALSQMAFLNWMETLTLRATLDTETDNATAKRSGKWTPPRASEHQGIEQAMAMADRFNRISNRTLRTLRDQRRTTLIVQNAGQVNVGKQQVNVQNAGADECDDRDES